MVKPALLCLALAPALLSATALTRGGKPLMPILAGSAPPPAAELRSYLQQISGAEFAIRKAAPGAHGIYVGVAADFPWLKIPDAAGLGAEGFVLQSRGRELLLLGEQPAGVQHAVSAFLESLGCRWFFPGKLWEVVPRRASIQGEWRERSIPTFPLQRGLWYGFGAEPELVAQLGDWLRHNRMGGPLRVSIAHTWYGLDPEKDFKEHPDWFGFSNGRRQPLKPCYTHPEFLRRAIAYALDQAAKGVPMISLTAPDYMGFCECDRCLKYLRGGERFRVFDALFSRLPDGTELSLTSETFFRFANEVAKAVAQKYPQTLLGCLFYSAYAHPPSFKLEPNLFLQATAAIRRTNLTLPEELKAMKPLVSRIGIYDYYAVYQWDWDYPDPGRVVPSRLVKDLQMYAANGVTSLNAEACNNWAPRGLGYYVASKLLWDVHADVNGLIDDFFAKAFGPAEAPMRRYYGRWYHFAVDAPHLEWKDELATRSKAGSEVTDESLRASYQDLNAAADLAAGQPVYLARVDGLRMYAHFLFLRRQLAKKTDTSAILAAIRDEMTFAGRLTYTNMIHFRPLQGREFPRRFRKYEAQLSTVPDAEKESWKKIGQPPDHAELERLWTADKKALGI